MKAQNFTTTIVVDKGPEEAFRAINNVSGWWAKNFKGKAEKRGDKFTVDFGQTFVDFEISELIPNKKIAWLVTDCNLHWISNKKEWNGTEVIFELVEKANSTQITFTHIGLTPGVECYEDCYAGWTGHITGSLVKLINEGKGMPE